MTQFGYVPTPKELETIRFMRREILYREAKLSEARRELAEYHDAIATEFNRQLRISRGEAA